jgi:hypothetical protein
MKIPFRFNLGKKKAEQQPTQSNIATTSIGVPPSRQREVVQQPYGDSVVCIDKVGLALYTMSVLMTPLNFFNFLYWGILLNVVSNYMESLSMLLFHSLNTCL